MKIQLGDGDFHDILLDADEVTYLNKASRGKITEEALLFSGSGRQFDEIHSHLSLSFCFNQSAGSEGEARIFTDQLVSGF